MNTPKLSCVIITYNEANRIVECLRPLKWIDEIVIIDGESTDNTQEICKRYTPHVYVNEFRNFSQQRNFGIQKATNEWILSLDVDEIITDNLRRQIKEAIAHPDNHKGFYLRRINYIYNHRDALNKPDWQLRLFNRQSAIFVEPIHERVKVDGPVGYLSGELLHFSIKDLKDHINKINFYTDFEIKRMSNKKISFRWFNIPWYFVFKPLIRFFQNYVLMKGYAGGLAGFIYSANSGVYEFVKQVKYWELTRPGK